MDFIIAFVLMVAAMLASIAAGISMLAPLGVGLIAFSIVAMRRGHALPAVIRMAAQGAWASRVVIVTMLPIGMCIALYGALSLLSAPESMDTSLLERFDMEYTLNAWCLAPTILLLVLAFAGLKIKYVMAIDIAVSMAIAVFLQRIPAPEMLRMSITGFASRDKYLSNILSGGGVVSMVNISLILLLSNAVGGIFEGAKLLAPVEGLIARLAKRIGRFGAMIITSVCACAVFCNQTIGIVMCRQCMHNSYGNSPEERNAMMLDIANSVTVIAALIPWCIACSVPITAMGCGLARFRSQRICICCRCAG